MRDFFGPILFNKGSKNRGKFQSNFREKIRPSIKNISCQLRSADVLPHEGDIFKELRVKFVVLHKRRLIISCQREVSGLLLKAGAVILRMRLFCLQLEPSCLQLSFFTYN